MTVEEFVSTERKRDGSGAAKGCGYTHEGIGYDCYTFYNSGWGGSEAERKSCGFGEAGGTGRPYGKGFGGRIKLK